VQQERLTADSRQEPVFESVPLEDLGLGIGAARRERFGLFVPVRQSGGFRNQNLGAVQDGRRCRIDDWSDGRLPGGIWTASGLYGRRGEKFTEEIPPVDELFQFRIGDAIRASLILCLIHGPVHANFEEDLGWLIGLSSDELVKVVGATALEIAPDKGGVALVLSRAELEILADQERSPFISWVSCSKRV
jgi:hypothetical protein